MADARMTAPIRVGIVGAHPDRGWARDAHIPALAALPAYTLAAVAARTLPIAQAAARQFGAARAYDDARALVQDDAIDLVVVTVRVPEHRAVVLAARAAGKHVYCEWPLGRDLDEAREMAAGTGAHQAVIGLQGLSAPALRQAAALIAEGRIGRPLVLRAFCAAAPWGAIAPPEQDYLQDGQHGATLATIGGGHTLAAIEALVGRYAEVDARTTLLHPLVPVAGTDRMLARTCADHMLVLGAHASGCVSTLEVRGGTSLRPALFEITGQTGWLRITGRIPGTYQIPELQLEASFPLPPPPPLAAPHLQGPPVNVAEAYARLAPNLRTATPVLPNFNDAVALTHLLELIDHASQTGQRQHR